jgi:hypothetical protein
MSGNIFGVKLMSLHRALTTTGVLAGLVNAASHYGVEYPLDNKERILLNTPDVLKAVCKKYGVRDCRVRIAFPACASFGELVEQTTFEMYSCDKLKLLESARVVELDDDLSNAVQVELFQHLLKAKGIDIPML